MIDSYLHQNLTATAATDADCSKRALEKQRKAIFSSHSLWATVAYTTSEGRGQKLGYLLVALLMSL